MVVRGQKMRLQREMNFTHVGEKCTYEIIIYKEVDTKDLVLGIFSAKTLTLITYMYLEVGTSLSEMFHYLRERLREPGLDKTYYEIKEVKVPKKVKAEKVEVKVPIHKSLSSIKLEYEEQKPLVKAKTTATKKKPIRKRSNKENTSLF